MKAQENNQQDNNVEIVETDKPHYRIEFEVVAVIKGDAALIQHEGTKEEVVNSVKQQLDFCGIVDLARDAMQITDIIKLKITPYAQDTNGDWVPVGNPIWQEIKAGDLIGRS